MIFARRALNLALVLLMLCVTFTASAQTLREETDPRNIAPTVGTGGPVGGATGLITVYDAQTLRRGEFTFSFAYSNFDRDPGDVDIVEIPVSFQVGLNDHVELFFNTDSFRFVHVNNPRNLSSFYLPNSPLRTAPAIILAPNRVSGANTISGSVFRPANNQPFVQFPFVGGIGPNFGLTGNVIAPPFVSVLGAGTSNASNFGAADTFPGIGSPVGSILPGIVLSTRTIPANLTFRAQTVPDLFTTSPSYLPDAPFINRTYGESSFNSFVFGAKFRLTGPDNPFGFAVMPFYRYWYDRGGDADDFNNLQRGSGGGGRLGDFGLVLALDGRLSRSVNMSVNFGYILNSNPQADFPAGTGTTAGERTLLDRPNEIISGLAFDFPINQYFQPIAELRSTIYTTQGFLPLDSRTPNAFENSPVDGLVGIRIYPRRWFGMTFWYRRHLNAQDNDTFDFPISSGFTGSTDPNGFGAQFFIGHRNERAPRFLPNQAPVVTLSASTTRVVLPAECGANQIPDPNCTPTEGGGGAQVQLTTAATDPDGDTLLYTYSTTGGRIVGEGPNVTLDLSGVAPGTYTTSVEVNDGCGCITYQSVEIVVERCPCIEQPPTCPQVSVSCPPTVDEGANITFTANVSGGDQNVRPIFNWTVSAGTITDGQGTDRITVSTAGLGGNATVTATVDVSGYGPNCQASSSCTTTTSPIATAREIDEYGDLQYDDEKARLDNLAIELQNNPQASATIIVYGGRRSPVGTAQRRGERARTYLVNERGIDAGRITVVDGGFREDLTTELWVVPAGAQQPAASPTVDASEVTPAPERRPRRPRRGRR
jgi:hypothetical protein